MGVLRGVQYKTI